MLIDFGAPLNAKDDFQRKPYDEAVAIAAAKGGVMEPGIKNVFEKYHAGTLKRSTAKYDEPLFVKYLTPVEQVKELEEFISRVKDWSTLTKKDDKQNENEDDSSDYSQDIEQQVERVNKGNQMNTQNNWQ